MIDNVIKEMKNYAHLNNVPIITDDGLNYLIKYIKEHNIKNILEIGTAIGYSAICMCNVSNDINITTIERDENRYKEAINNVTKANLNDRINIIFGDALEVDVDGKYDLIFIDAAKAQNIKFFEKYEINLNDNGTIITDNMNFHGLVNVNSEDIKSRDLRQLVRKVNNYKLYLENNNRYNTDFLNIGDGLAVSKKKE